MKLTKQAFIKTIEPYTKRNYGEIVIERSNVHKLEDVLFATFDNIGCSVEEGVRSEKLVISSLTKGGIRRYMDIPIVDTAVFDSEIWDINIVVKQLLILVEQYGYDVFKDNKRAAALVGDVLVKYSNECKVMKVLFREGFSEVLGSIPYKNERELKLALHRVELFMQNMGMSQKVIANVKNVVKRVFIKHDTYKAGKDTHGCIENSDFGELSSAIQRTIVEEIPSGTMKPGSVFSLSMSNQDDGCLIRTEAYAVSGSGIFRCSNDEFSDSCRSAFDMLRDNKCFGMASIEKFNLAISYQDFSGINSSKNLILPSIISMMSAITQKSVLEGLAVLGGIGIAGNVDKVKELPFLIRRCEQIRAKRILIPIYSAVDIPDVPTELLEKFGLIFYMSAEDAVRKALGLK